jgi:hypothetical protein
MTESPCRSFCCFCKHEFRDGEGRYRLLQREEQVDCCLACFDGLRTFPAYPLEEPAEKQPALKKEKIF